MNWIVQAILLIYFVSVFALGILGKKKTKDMADYYVAGRKVSGLFAGLVYISTMVSAGALVGWVSQAWQWGFYFLYAANAVTVATFLCWWFLGRKIRTIGHKLDLYTIPDFLEIRFESPAARLVASLIIIIFSIPLLVSNFMAVGYLFNVAAGLSYKAAIICFGIIIFMYVAFGGYYAVIYTDLLQGLMMLIGVIIIYCAARNNAGAEPILRYKELFPEGLVTWPGKGSATSPAFFLSFVLLTFFGALGSPNYIRGFYSLRDSRAFNQGFSIVISVVAILEVVIVFIGLYARVIFPELDVPDNAVYYLIQILLPPLLAGIALTCLAAAIMSTVDSLLIQCASTVENDILSKTFRMNLSEKKRILVARITVAVIGIISVIWATNPPEYLALLWYPAWGAMGLAFSWVFFLGLFWKRFNKAGAIAAMISSSAVFTIWNAVGNPFGIYHIQMALLVSIPVTLAATLLTPPSSEETLKKFF